MGVWKLLGRVLAMLPALVGDVETLYGARTGAQKRAAVLELVGAALGALELGGSHEVDPAQFTAALGVVVDGLVACLNATVWRKRVPAGSAEIAG